MYSVCVHAPICHWVYGGLRTTCQFSLVTMWVHEMDRRLSGLSRGTSPSQSCVSQEHPHLDHLLMTGPLVLSHNHCIFEVGARGIKKIMLNIVQTKYVLLARSELKPTGGWVYGRWLCSQLLRRLEQEDCLNLGV